MLSYVNVYYQKSSAIICYTVTYYALACMPNAINVEACKPN